MKNEITKSIKNLINYLARKYSKNDNWKFDEITQELYISVLKSDENFKEGTGACWQTYAIGNIKYAIISFLKNQNNKKNEDDNFEKIFEDFPTDSSFNFYEIFEERTALIFDLRFNKQVTLREISTITGVSHQRIHQIIKKNKKDKKLLKILTEE